MISVGSSYHYRINWTCIFIISDNIQFLRKNNGRRGSMVVFFTTAHAISAYYHYSCEFIARCALCNVCQWLTTCWWFSLGTPLSSTNKTDRHDIAEVALNTITPTIGNIIKIIVCCIILNKHVRTHQYVHLGEYVHMIHVILSQVPCIYMITWRTTFNGRGNIGYSWIITPSWRKYLTNLFIT
jgi:hypothetical protein